MSLAVDRLRERLASLGAAPPRPRPDPVARRPPAGFEPVATPYGTAWRLADVLPLGRVPGILPAPAHAYLDTETTGLAGGTGTLVFAAAVARPVRAGLEVVQLFLAEPSGEAAFLHALAAELAAAEALGTYNGSTFDLPLLRSRWVMARMPGELAHPPHTDLLRLVQALLRHRLLSCALRSVEVGLLGFEREHDLPAALAPEAYFAYLRGSGTRCLEAALEHNRQDVVSLLHLHARLLLRVEGGDPWMEAADWLALGRHLLRAGRRADGWRALRNAAAMVQAPASGAAALLIARRLVRAGRFEAAARLLAAVHDALPEQAPLAVARARILEWRLRDLPAALAVVESALTRTPPAGPVTFDLEWRRARLLEKLAVGRRRGPRRGSGHRLLLDELPPGGQQSRVVGAR